MKNRSINLVDLVDLSENELLEFQEKVSNKCDRYKIFYFLRAKNPFKYTDIPPPREIIKFLMSQCSLSPEEEVALRHDLDLLNGNFSKLHPLVRFLNMLPIASKEELVKEYREFLRAMANSIKTLEDAISPEMLFAWIFLWNRVDPDGYLRLLRSIYDAVWFTMNFAGINNPYLENLSNQLLADLLITIFNEKKTIIEFEEDPYGVIESLVEEINSSLHRNFGEEDENFRFNEEIILNFLLIQLLPNFSNQFLTSWEKRIMEAVRAIKDNFGYNFSLLATLVIEIYENGFANTSKEKIASLIEKIRKSFFINAEIHMFVYAFSRLLFNKFFREERYSDALFSLLLPIMSKFPVSPEDIKRNLEEKGNKIIIFSHFLVPYVTFYRSFVKEGKISLEQIETVRTSTFLKNLVSFSDNKAKNYFKRLGRKLFKGCLVPGKTKKPISLLLSTELQAVPSPILLNKKHVISFSLRVPDNPQNIVNPQKIAVINLLEKRKFKFPIQEEKVIGEIFRDSEVFFGEKNISKKKFMDALLESDIFHIIAHGAPFSDSIDLGGIEIFLEEISEISVEQNKLVFINRCYGGTGDFIDSLNMSNFNLLFHSAGAQFVISSPVEVPDYEAFLFAKNFYMNLREKKDIVDAFWEASEQYPYYNLTSL